MNDRICAVQWCHYPARAYGLCKSHRRREIAGQPLDKPFRGTVMACAVEDCGTRAVALGLCHKHYSRHRAGRPLIQSPRDRWLKEVVTYDAAHKRVIVERGRPSDHPCADCGRLAEEWSYDHGDASEIAEARKVAGKYLYECFYSLNPDHYQPRCMECHRHYDRLRTSGRKAA